MAQTLQLKTKLKKGRNRKAKIKKTGKNRQKPKYCTTLLLLARLLVREPGIQWQPPMAELHAGCGIR
jgi:hypothetical protein